MSNGNGNDTQHGDGNGLRVAMITGGASGIGAAIARQLGAQGLRIVIADLDAQASQRTVAELAGAQLQASAIAIDVTAPASIADAFAELSRRHGRCDVLVNCAGIAKTYPFLDFPLDNWQRTMDVNLTGALLCSQHAGRMMQPAGWGRIVNIASVAGLRAVGVGRTAYGTSKAALIALTRQMAVELAAHGITANAVCPGPVDTPLTRELHSEKFRAEYTRAIPMNRYGTTDEVAAVVGFLASEGASYVTGAAIPVDGGFLAAGARPD
jgi:3-oxoacyl-[acyl-carrier protein] reductase